MYRIVLCLVLCLSVFAQVFAIEDCGSKVGSYTNVTVTNCDTEKSTCILKRGTDATITIYFNIDQDVNKINAVVHGIIGGAEIPFPLAHPNGCDSSGLSCPLQKANGPFQYEATLSIQRLYPRLKVIVKWELKDEAGQDIVCVLIPSQIK